MKWVLLTLIVISTVLADYLQSYEMKRSGEQSLSATSLRRLLLRIFRQRYLIIAVFFMAVSFFAFMALVQIAPLSFAVPASAATLVLDTLVARFALKEHVGWKRTAGAALVTGGVLLIAR